MIRKYVLPILAGTGFLFAVYAVISGTRPLPAAPPVAAPSETPFGHSIAASGLVEARNENIAIGTFVPGVVTEVHVVVGAAVAAGDPLFTIDDREVRATLDVRAAEVRAAEESVARFEGLPRPEDVPPAEARVVAAKAALADAEDLYQMWDTLPDKRAVSAEALSRRRFACDLAAARLKGAEAELAQLNAGAWAPDLAIAKAALARARAERDAAQVALERHRVRAPIAGRVLQVKIRRGEYAQAAALATPLVLLGDTSRLQVRADIDENDAWRMQPGAPARAFLRGNRDYSTELRFEGVEPYVIPKRSLTGESTERVDTRVLQVIFSFDPAGLPIYVGQQLDVFVEAAPGRREDRDAAAPPGRTAR